MTDTNSFVDTVIVKRFVILVTIAATVCYSFSATASDRRNQPLAAAKKRVDPAAEQRNQDVAVSLLIETFRSLQTYKIDADYQVRVHEAERLADAEQRLQATRVAEQYRAGRLRDLEGQLAQFHTAYVALRVDQQRSGESPKSADAATVRSANASTDATAH